MAHGRNRRRALRAARAAARAAALLEPPFTFLDMPCDLLTCLGPVASTPGYEREVDGTQCLCRAARDDAMLGAATAGLRYKSWRGDMRSRLAYACSVNDEARVAWLLECGARDVLAAAEDGYTGGAALVRRLAPHPLVDATAALVAAAHVGVADVVAPLVARGAQLEGAAYVGDWMGTALQKASGAGHVGVVAALLAAGAAVDAADNMGTTVLMHAAMRGHLEVAQALVAAGADVNRRSASGMSAASWAARTELIRGEPVAAYLCALPQAEPGVHIATEAWLGDVQRVRDFIARGASVEERDSRYGATCLMLAAERGHAEVVRVLLGAGADVGAAWVWHLRIVLCRGPARRPGGAAGALRGGRRRDAPGRARHSPPPGRGAGHARGRRVRAHAGGSGCGSPCAHAIRECAPRRRRRRWRHAARRGAAAAAAEARQRRAHPACSARLRRDGQQRGRHASCRRRAWAWAAVRTPPAGRPPDLRAAALAAGWTAPGVPAAGVGWIGAASPRAAGARSCVACCLLAACHVRRIRRRGAPRSLREGRGGKPHARGPLPSPPPIECTRTSHFLRARPALIPPPHTHAACTLCLRDSAHAARDARAAPRSAHEHAAHARWRTAGLGAAPVAPPREPPAPPPCSSHRSPSWACRATC